MDFLKLIRVELIKSKRARMFPLLFIAPLLVVISGVANLSMYLTPEYTNAWAAMFIQSALLYAYYLLPFSMLAVCLMLTGRETQNGGLTKMLSLPVRRPALALGKFCVLALFLLLEMAVFLSAFVLAGLFALRGAQITQTVPTAYLLKCCLGLFLSMLPCMAVMWAITAAFEKPLISLGLNLFLVLPGVLAAATPFWMLYPYCYSGYLISLSLHSFTAQGGETALSLFPFLPCAVLFFISGLGLAAARYGREKV